MFSTNYITSSALYICSNITLPGGASTKQIYAILGISSNGKTKESSLLLDSDEDLLTEGGDKPTPEKSVRGGSVFISDEEDLMHAPVKNRIHRGSILPPIHSTNNSSRTPFSSMYGGGGVGDGGGGGGIHHLTPNGFPSQGPRPSRLPFRYLFPYFGSCNSSIKCCLSRKIIILRWLSLISSYECTLFLLSSVLDATAAKQKNSFVSFEYLNMPGVLPRGFVNF